MLVHGAALAEEHHLDCAFAVPTNLYGPGDDFDPQRSHLVAALIRKFLAGDGTCWGTGRATRDLLFVRDCAEGVVRLLEVGGGPSPVNLGSGEERTTAEIAEAVARATGFDGAIRWDADKPDGMPRKVLDVTRARTRLGWSARTSLADGLLETVAWFRSSS
jgi:nucleoside-diphosphate-sugar epimerase